MAETTSHDSHMAPFVPPWSSERTERRDSDEIPETWYVNQRPPCEEFDQMICVAFNFVLDLEGVVLCASAVFIERGCDDVAF